MKISVSILAAAGALALAAPVHAAPLYNWTGAYIGAHGDYGWSHSQATYDNDPFTNFTLAPVNTTGAGIGIEGGANYQLGNGFVLGVEGAVTYAHVSATTPDDAGTYAHGGDQTITSTTDWSGDLRGRAGFAFDRYLVFGTVGVAAAHVTVNATDGDISDNATLTGVAFGGGVENALTDKVSVKLEYIHTVFGNHTWFAGEDYSSTGNGTSDAVRLGLNLHF